MAAIIKHFFLFPTDRARMCKMQNGEMEKFVSGGVGGYRRRKVPDADRQTDKRVGSSNHRILKARRRQSSFWSLCKCQALTSL